MLRPGYAPYLLAAALVFATGAAPLAAPAAAQESPAPTIASLLSGDGELRLAGRLLDRAALSQIYEARGFQPIWIGLPEQVAALEKALVGATAHGLDPHVFAVPLAPPAERDLLLTDAFLRYASALAQGRVNPAEIETDWAMPAPHFDAAAALDEAARGDVAATLESLAPADPGYRRLQAALVRYRAIVKAGGWRRVPYPGKLQLGDINPAVEKLRRRFVAEGFLAPELATGDSFDADVEDAVKRFQAQHGIAVDGTVGPSTNTALNVSASVRLEQIRANLERWREMPRSLPATRIEVNVPAAWLTVIEHGEPGLGMRAIVGADDHPTPVLRARMNAVLFNPPWNLPASIVRNEILPKLKHDPRYLQRNHYVYLGKPGASALQQLPGPDNALGQIKFEMPNSFDVYLHDTPSHPLFTRVIRTLSHGCVRLEEPRDLALYVLGTGKTVWSPEDIDAVIAAGETRRVPLAHSIPVYLVYWTAFVDADGAVEFRDDIYGRDQRLGVALAARDAAEQLAPATIPAASLPVTPVSAPGRAPKRQKAALN